MTIEDIKTLKDKVYELEGLLELAQLREEKIDELTPLIERRLRDITKSVRTIEENDEKPRFVTLPLFEADATGTMLRKKRKEEAPVEKMEEKVIVDEKSEEESIEKSETEPLEQNDEELDEEIYNIPDEKPEQMEMQEKNNMEFPTLSDSVSVTGRVSEKSYRPQPQAKPAFCINDRFRFRRELFGGSDESFNAAMNKMAMMDNYDEAEEYFIGELGWDPEKEEVVDFLEIIRNYFE